MRYPSSSGAPRRRTAASVVALGALVLGSLGVGAPPARAAVPVSATFAGRGWGHGIGMSQWGARGFAEAGWSAERILTHYYTGTAVAPAATPDALRVGLAWDRPSVNGTTAGGATATCSVGWSAPLPAGDFAYASVDDAGQRVGLLRTGAGAEVVRCPGATSIDAAATPVRLATTGHEYRRGALELSVQEGSASVRAVVELRSTGTVPATDAYLYGLGEVPSSWPAEALRAQVVAARSYALEKLARTGQRRTSPPCDCALVATTFDQAYVGWAKESEPRYGARWVEAVNSTSGLAVTYQGAPIAAYYSSSSGGRTEDNDLVWGGTPLPYLRGVDDPYDAAGGNPNAAWSVTLPWESLEAKLNASTTTAVGELASFEVVPPLGGSGRVTPVRDGAGGVRIVGSAGTKRVSGDEVRRVLALKSTLFAVSVAEAPSPPSPVARLDAADPLDAALRISARRFGPDASSVAVVSRADVFVDSLAGAPLSADAPLLLTAPGALDERVGAELDRVLASAGTVYLLGGEAALSPAVADAVAARGHRVVRLAGADRVGTALAVAEEVRRLRPPTGPTVVALARSTASGADPTAAWADSVTGGAWAAVAGVPVVVTPTEALHPEVAAALRRWGTTRTVLLGGTAALAPVVEAAVPGPQRVGGADRAATAALVATVLWGATPPGYLVVPGAVADGWAYGLVAAGLAADASTPVLLAYADALPAATARQVRPVACPGEPTRVEVVGPTSAVSAATEAALARAAAGCA